MVRFLVRRTPFGALVLWVVVTMVFLLYFAVPHDPARLVTGRQAIAGTIAAVRRTLWLDRPLPVQYWRFLDLIVHGDLISFRSNEKVTRIIADALPVDISLAAGASVLWMVTGVGIGVLAARRPRSIADRVATAFVLFFLAVPTFEVGLLLLYFLFYLLRINGIRWFAAPGYVPWSAGLGSWALALLLPWLTLALTMAAPYARLTRNSLLDVLGEDYTRTARAKGMSERRVVYRHGLRSALTPIVSQFGVDLATVLGGVILVEQVFGLNRLGRIACSRSSIRICRSSWVQCSWGRSLSSRAT